MTTPTFSFKTDSLDTSNFTVISFVGNERISRLYRYVIELKVLSTVDLDTDVIIDENVVFTIVSDGSLEILVHGVLSSFNYTHSDSDYNYFQAILVPKLYDETLNKFNQIYKKKTVIEIILNELEEAQLKETEDFEFDLSRDYAVKEYVCQFDESNLDFISRLMEFHGIYYYFVHSATHSKMIITDSGADAYAELHESYPDFGGDSVCEFANSPTGDAVYSSINSISKTTNKTAAAVAIRGYDASQPSLSVDADTQGNKRLTLNLAGENVIDPDEASTIAQIRLEEVNTDKNVFDGISGICALSPGHCISVTHHSLPSINTSYLLVGVIHKGSIPDATAGQTLTSSASYTNEFRAIKSSVAFRPKQVTARPRFFGTQSGEIYAEQDDPWTAEIDPEGRYRVKLHFINSDLKEEASCWMRMAQSAAGEKDGIFIPLKAGVEVLITFINGDPDRPVIQGALSNGKFPSSVTSNNSHHGLIATSGLLALKAEGGMHVDVKVDENSRPTRGANKNIPAVDDDYEIRTIGLSKDQVDNDADQDAAGSPGEGQVFDYTKKADNSNVLTVEEEMNSDYIVKRLEGDVYTKHYGNIIKAHYGNTYDYSSNWTFSFGNGYGENHLDYGSRVNRKEDQDLLDKGGADWAKLVWPDAKKEQTKLPDDARWINGNVWVGKTYGGSGSISADTKKSDSDRERWKGGLSYSYSEGDVISVTRNSNTLNITHGSGLTNIDLVYRGSGTLKSWSHKRPEPNKKIVTETKNWNSKGTKTAETKNTYKGAASPSPDYETDVEEKKYTVSGGKKYYQKSENFSSKTGETTTTEDVWDYSDTSTKVSHSYTKVGGRTQSSIKKNWAETSASTYDYAASATFSVSAAAKTSASFEFGAVSAFTTNVSGSISVEISGALSAVFKTGAGMGVEVDARVGGTCSLKHDGMKFEGIGFTARKKAAIDAQKADMEAFDAAFEIRQIKMRIVKNDGVDMSAFNMAMFNMNAYFML